MRIYRYIPELRKPNGEQDYSVVAEHTDTGVRTVLTPHIEQALARDIAEALSIFERDITERIKTMRQDERQ